MRGWGLPCGPATSGHCRGCSGYRTPLPRRASRWNLFQEKVREEQPGLSAQDRAKLWRDMPENEKKTYGNDAEACDVAEKAGNPEPLGPKRRKGGKADDSAASGVLAVRERSQQLAVMQPEAMRDYAAELRKRARATMAAPAW